MAYDNPYPYYQQQGHSQLPTTGDGGYGTSYNSAPNVQTVRGYAMPGAYRGDVNQNDPMSASGHNNPYDPARNQGNYMHDQHSYGQQNSNTTQFQHYGPARYDQNMPHQTLQQPGLAAENAGAGRAAPYQQPGRGYQQQSGDYQHANNARAPQGSWHQNQSSSVNHVRNASSGSSPAHAYQADVSRARPPSTGPAQTMQQGFNRPYYPPNPTSPPMTSASTSAVQRPSNAHPTSYQAQVPDTRPLSSYAPVQRTHTPQQQQRSSNAKRTGQTHRPPPPPPSSANSTALATARPPRPTPPAPAAPAAPLAGPATPAAPPMPQQYTGPQTKEVSTPSRPVGNAKTTETPAASDMAENDGPGNSTGKKKGRPVGSKNKPKDKKDKKEEDMKNMLEKLLQFQNQDPTKFASLMDEVKKAQPEADQGAQGDQAGQTSDPGLSLQQAAQAGFGASHDPKKLVSGETQASRPVPTSLTDAPGIANPQDKPAGSKSRGKSTHAGVTSTKPVPAFVDLTDAAQAASFSHNSQAPYLNQRATTQAAQSPDSYQQIRPNSQVGQQPPPAENPVTATGTGHVQLQRPTQGSQPSTQSGQNDQGTGPRSPQNANREHSATLWPEARRNKLVMAAKVMLESTPGNGGKVLDVENFRQFLNQNPSYETLCQLLEEQGWQFARSDLARVLLAIIENRVGRETPVANISRPLATNYPNSGVRPGAYHLVQSPLSPEHVSDRPQAPAVLQNAAPAITVQAIGQQSTGGHALPSQTTSNLEQQAAPAEPAFQAYDPPRTSAAAPRISAKQLYALVEGKVPSAAPPQQQGSGASQDKVKGAVTAQSDTNLTPSAASAPALPTPEPRNKHEAARKRTFADLIDLTNQDDDDEQESLEIQQELERARKRQAIQRPDERFVEKQSGQGPTEATTGKALPAPSRAERFRPHHWQSGPTTSSRETLRNEEVVKPLDHAQAKRASAYNPRTIARDFFLAKGEHPQMKPLNWHLEPMFNTFKSMKVDSDLATIRWDLIDPGDPVISPENVTNQPSYDMKVTNQESTSVHMTPATKARAPTTPALEVPTPKTPAVKAPAVGASLAQQQDEESESDQGDEDGMIMPAAPVEQPVPSRKISPAGSSRMSVRVKKIDVSTADSSDTLIRSETDMPSSQPATETRSLASTARRATGPAVRRSRGRPPRQTGVPSRGRATARSGASPRAHSTRNPTTTPKSFGNATPKNAVDLSASGMDAPSFVSSSGKQPPNKRASEAPTSRSGSVSVVLPQGSDVDHSLVDKHGSPARTFSSGKRVGRPPGSKNRMQDRNHDDTSITGSPSVRGSRGRGRPRGVGSGGFRARGRGGRARSAGQKHYQLQIRTAIPGDGIGVKVPQVDTHEYRASARSFTDRKPLPLVYDPDIVSRQRDRSYGKDSKIHHPQPATTYPDTDRFQVFKCQWHGCSSELHNLDTLRKHIGRVHLAVYNGNPDLSVECLWRMCCNDSTDEELHRTYAKPATGQAFAYLEDLERHIEEEHVLPVAWRQGDGPNAKPKGPDPTKFLCDPVTGRVVTPTAKTYGDGPPDPLLHLDHENRAEFVRAYHKAHGNLTRKSRTRAKLYSRLAVSADECRFEGQERVVGGSGGGSGDVGGEKRHDHGLTQWKHMTMDGIRVEVPLSLEARRRLGWPEEGDVLEVWRDPDPAEEAARARTEIKERKRRYEYSASGESDEDSDEDEEEDNDGEVDEAEAGEEAGRGRDYAHAVAGEGSDREENEEDEEDDDDTHDHDRPAMFTSPGRVSMGIMAPSTLAVGRMVEDSEDEGDQSMPNAMEIRRNEP